MPRVIHFEILADDPQRAIEFYTKVFGWGIKKWEGPMDYWLVNTGPENQPGIHGGIMNRQHPASCINTIDVPSVDDFAAKIKKQGGKILGKKMPIPGVGWHMYCRDTEGNIIGILQMDKSVK